MDCLDFEYSCNLSSNYTQLGLAFTLYSAEVLFNKGNSFIQHSFPSSSKEENSVSGLSLIYLDQVQEGMAELQDAARQKATEEHSVIDEAIRDRGEGYTVFSIVRPQTTVSFVFEVDWIRSPLVYSTARRRTSSGTPRHVISSAKLYATLHCRK